MFSLAVLVSPLFNYRLLLKNFFIDLKRERKGERESRGGERERERGREREREGERERRETLICCPTYLCIHSLILVCGPTRD